MREVRKVVTKQIKIGVTEISSEKNSNSECQKCISEILSCLTENGITCETALAILDECKERINISCAKTSLKDLF